MHIIIAVVAGLVSLIMGFLLGITIHRNRLKTTFNNAQQESEQILEEAEKERQKIINDAHREAKQEAKLRRQNAEKDYKQKRSEISKIENKLRSREQAIEKKLGILDNKESNLEKMTGHLNDEEQRYKKLITECEDSLEQNRKTLESIANLSQQEAKKELIKSLEGQAKSEAKDIIKKIEEEAQLEGLKRAQSTVSLAVQRVSSEYVNDSTVTVVGLPNDEMKGRIIGREGRNIRAIEQATGVDLIIDDTPEAIILSSFNPIRREIAKIALNKLIADGRIHPARISETVKKVTDEFEQVILENGEQAAFDIGITDLPTGLLKHLGKLKYRTTGRQTVLQHSLEVAHICGIMAAEMSIDVKKAQRAGLLHDIGKSVDQEIEGHHAEIGQELLKKHKESDELISAIGNHHSEHEICADMLTTIVHAANTLSASRPGARRELLESYVKRLNDMEKLVYDFEKIEKCFVIQAGREIRAIVSPSGVSDEEVVELSRNIAFKLRSEMTIPGQVKVTVLRESQHVDYAK